LNNLCNIIQCNLHTVFSPVVQLRARMSLIELFICHLLKGHMDAMTRIWIMTILLSGADVCHTVYGDLNVL